MFVQLVHIEVKPDRIEDFLAAFRINFVGTTREPENRRFDLLQSKDDPTRFTVVEMFDRAESVDLHRQTSHYSETVALLDDIMAGPRTKDYYRLVMSDLLTPAV